MAAGSAAERKAELRARYRGARGQPRAEAARAALERLLGLPELVRARTVAFYAAIGDEVPVEAAAELCRARGSRVVYPVVAGLALELAERPGRPERVPVEEIELFVVPGLLFDRTGLRLGRGGGHYDRLLARRSPGARVVGICYADRVVAELPREAWDEAMDLVVSDRETLRFDR
ncbi:MAG TPA: 5-formyltetrahydrofolate cyclo-ligase [Myxococcota bacterium]|nr:5-formyltetrahydrofolate cyclo-ligase [Myxococcota bacterium]